MNLNSRSFMARYPLLLWGAAAAAMIAVAIYMSLSPADIKKSDPFSSDLYKGQLTIRYLHLDGPEHTGDAIVIQSPDGKTMLLDAGMPETGEQVVAYLNRLGIRTLDAAVNTHPHIDHIGGFAAVMKAVEVKRFYMLNTKSSLWGEYYQNVMKLLLQKKIETTYIEEGTAFRLGSDVLVEVLHPRKGQLPAAIDGPDLHVPVNQNSAVLKITYKQQSFLFTGDIYKETEEELLAAYGKRLDADFLHAGHHGLPTSTSSSFVQAVSPQAMVMSSNQFTNISLAYELRQSGIGVFSPTDNGTILIASDGKRLRVIPEKYGENPSQLTFYYAYSGSSYKTFMESYGKYIQQKFPNTVLKFLQNEEGSTIADLVKTGTPVDVFITSNSGMVPLREQRLVGTSPIWSTNTRWNSTGLKGPLWKR